MIYPAGLYEGSSKYLALYNYHSDVYVKPPADFNAKYVAHFSYEYGNRKGGVDVFQINEGENPKRIAKLVTYVTPELNGFNIKKDNCKGKRENHIAKTRLFNASAIHNINSQIIIDLPKREKGEIIDFTSTDILEFCEGVEAKKRITPCLIFVDKIIPKTEVKYINPEVMLTTGKQEFVPSCLLEANIDFGKGCISSFLPGEGIESGKAGFDGETFTNYFTSPWGECSYCYAGRDHRCFPKTLYKFNRKRLEEELKGGFILDKKTKKTLRRPVKVLRFGKRTESYTPFTRDSFLQTLEACAKIGTQAVIPTKMLPYDEEIVRLLKKSKSSVLFSIGNDEFEIGACAHGFNNKMRIENAVKYHEKGVNTSLYLTFANPLEINEEEWRIINSATKKGIRVQVLPIRYKRKNVMKAMCGLNWDSAKNTQTDLFREDNKLLGTYYHEGNQLIPIVRRMDSRLISIVGDNKGDVCMCHHDDQKTYCGGCGVAKGRMCEREKFIKRRYKGR